MSKSQIFSKKININNRLRKKLCFNFLAKNASINSGENYKKIKIGILYNLNSHHIANQLQVA